MCLLDAYLSLHTMGHENCTLSSFSKKVTSVSFKLFCQNGPFCCAGALKTKHFGQKVESAKMHFGIYTCSALICSFFNTTNSYR